jgi:hypothetical protein
VGVVQHHLAVEGAQAVDLGAQGGVVGIEVGVRRGDLGRVRFLRRSRYSGSPSKVVDRAQLVVVWPGIERGARRVAIDVDDRARDAVRTMVAPRSSAKA